MKRALCLLVSVTIMLLFSSALYNLTWKSSDENGAINFDKGKLTAVSHDSAVYAMSNSVTSYFNLHEIKDDLQCRNADLEREEILLRMAVDQLEQKAYADTMTIVEPLSSYKYIIAHVINNSIYRPYNYITIKKGAVDGVRPEMGVVDQNGVVGIVNLVSDKYARIISLMNPNFRLSCKLKGSDVFGSLVWDGRSPDQALLEELPKHTVFQPGDTIVTSGYSAIFPEGIPVGTVISSDKDVDDNFFTLRVNLLANFSRLSTVRLITNDDIDGISEIEKDPIISKKL